MIQILGFFDVVFIVGMIIFLMVLSSLVGSSDLFLPKFRKFYPFIVGITFVMTIQIIFVAAFN